METTSLSTRDRNAETPTLASARPKGKNVFKRALTASLSGAATIN